MNDCRLRGENMSYIDVINESKFYGKGSTKVTANDAVSFSIQKNEFAIIVGPSGAGKSTLLNILGGMDSPDEGEILIDGTDIAKFNEKQLTNYRREDIGFIFPKCLIDSTYFCLIFSIHCITLYSKNIIKFYSNCCQNFIRHLFITDDFH